MTSIDDLPPAVLGTLREHETALLATEALVDASVPSVARASLLPTWLGGAGDDLLLLTDARLLVFSNGALTASVERRELVAVSIGYALRSRARLSFALESGRIITATVSRRAAGRWRELVPVQDD